MYNKRCDLCDEPTKRPVGHWDGHGESGSIYSCSNKECVIVKESEAAAQEAARTEKEVREINAGNGIDVPAFEELRKDKRVSLRAMAMFLDVSPALFCDWTHHRKPFPPAKYEAGMKYLTRGKKRAE